MKNKWSKKKVIIGMGLVLFIVFIYTIIASLSDPMLAVVGEINIEKARNFDYAISGKQILYNDDTNIFMVGFSGKVEKTIPLEYRTVYYGDKRVYLVDKELGRIDAYDYELEEVWKSDLKDAVNHVKEEGDFLYIIKNAGKNFDAVYVLDKKGSVVMQRPFEDERVLEVYQAGKDKYFVTTFRAGADAIYSNVYLVDSYGKILVQNNYENQVVTRLQVVDEKNYIIYTDNSVARISENKKIWEDTVEEDIVDYTFFNDEIYMAYKENGLSFMKQIDKENLNQKDYKTERNIQRLIPFSSIIGVQTEDGIYYFDEKEMLKPLYISDPPAQRIIQDGDQAILVFDEYIQVVKLTKRIKWGNPS